MQRLLINLGFVIASAGLLYPSLKEIGLGQLPGEIILKGEKATFYFPIVSCISISLLFFSV